MKLTKGSEIAGLLAGMIYAKRQVRERSADLTIREIRLITGAGSVDFGGSECRAAPSETVPPRRREPEDEYGWWSLKKGVYRIRFNEELTGSLPGVGLILPSMRLLEAGGFHPAILLDGDSLPPALLNVGDNGIELKENARVSTLIVLRQAE